MVGWSPIWELPWRRAVGRLWRVRRRRVATPMPPNARASPRRPRNGRDCVGSREHVAYMLRRKGGPCGSARREPPSGEPGSGCRVPRTQRPNAEDDRSPASPTHRARHARPGDALPGVNPQSAIGGDQVASPSSLRMVSLFRFALDGPTRLYEPSECRFITPV